MNLKIYTGKQIKKFRKSQGVNQQAFWKDLGVTQSGGSRFETGRALPRTVNILLNIRLQEPKISREIVTALRQDFRWDFSVKGKK